MEFEIPKSKVYIQTDAEGCIIRCEGGYTTPADLTDWMYIDEGIGDRYNLCQGNYFDGGLYTMDGIPRYKWTGEEAMLRSEDAIEQDRASVALPEQPPTQQEAESSVWEELDAAYREGVNSAYDS